MKPNLVTGNEPPNDAGETEYYVLGGGPVGEAVAERLSADGHTTTIVDESYDSSELPGREGDPADIQTLKEAGLSDGATVIVATRRDRRNLLIAQLVRAHFDVSRILVLVNVPNRYDVLVEAGHEPVCATTVLSDALVGCL